MRASHLHHSGFHKATILGLATLFIATVGAAERAYRDPQGRFEVQVPGGWQVAPDPNVDQTILSSGPFQVIIAVIPQDPKDPMTAQQFMDVMNKEFADQCPTFKERKHGADIVGGAPGIASLFTCSDRKKPSVAETFSALTPDNTLIDFTTIAPLARYLESLPFFDGIRNSLRLPGESNASASHAGGDSLAVNELKRACTAGAFSQEECARRMGIEQGREAQAAGGPTAAGLERNTYRDAQGRFSLQMPSGWRATAEGENGSLGVQLRMGTSWINVFPAEPAASTSEVVLHQEEKIAHRSGSGRTPPFGQGGLVQLFGNSVELTYDHFPGVSPQGDTVESYIDGVGALGGTSHTYLLMVASMSPEQESQAGAVFLAVAQSSQFGAQ